MEKRSAMLTINKAFVVAPVDKRLYGTFIEPIHHIIYGNLYQPGHKTANELGFREDVIQLLKELSTTMIRFPGGNYVSGYHWRDGIGPKEERPVRFDKAWRQIDTNQVGIDDYMDCLRLIGAEPMLAVNLGTGSAEEAADEVEYCNFECGTTLSDLRKAYGHKAPYGIKLWCLGNEMDGFWQIEQRSPENYGHVAREAAKQMKWVDPSIETVACGSCTNEVGMETYAEWDRVVLEACYEQVEYLSLHRYYSYDPSKSMAYPSPFTIEDITYITKDLSDYLETVIAAADFVRGKKHLDKRIHISFDEWGVQTCHTVAPKGLDWHERTGLAEKDGQRITNMIDAVLYGSILITFLNRCDRVKIACQSIVIGGMIAVSPDTLAFRQTTFFPFQHAATYGHGTVLKQNLISPMVQSEHFGQQPAIQTAAVYHQQEGLITIFAVNLDLRESHSLECDLQGFGQVQLVEHLQLWDEQPMACNSSKNPLRIVPRSMPVEAGKELSLPPLSWNVLRYKIQ